MSMDLFQSVKTVDATVSALKKTGFYLPIFASVVGFLGHLGTCFGEPFSAALIALMKEHAFMSACVGFIFYGMLINMMVEMQVR